MSLKNDLKMSQREKFELINSEVRCFYEYCKEAGISDEEMDLICRPLTSSVRKASIKRWTRLAMFFTMIMAIGYTVSQTEAFHWHMTAIARLTLMKVLPVWDWTPLYYNKCLMDRSQPEHLNEVYISTNDCIGCEAIKNVDRICDTSYHEVFNHYLLRGAPVIVTDASAEWSSESDMNLTSLVGNDDRLRDSVPCRILTNLRIGRQPMDLKEIISRITDSEIPSWFLHFQNCDIRAVKAFRKLAPRPYFLSPYVPPSHFNWLLMSKNYDTHRFKYLELDIGLIIMSQIKGKSNIQLKPRACEKECNTLNFELKVGDTLILCNSIWEFEYLPSPGENLAIVTETEWNEI